MTEDATTSRTRSDIGAWVVLGVAMSASWPTGPDFELLNGFSVPFPLGEKAPAQR